MLKKVCKHMLHAGVCEKNGEFCPIGPCAEEELVEIAPVVHARWEFGEPDVLGPSVHCTNCGFGAKCVDRKAWLRYPGHRFCGACGAIMNKENTSDGKS